MPISKVDYNTSNTVIYKIQCVDGSCDFVYFGSTTNFACRKSQHKSICNNENNPAYNLNLYKTIRENKGWENFEMCLVEVYPCENKQQLVIREQFYIDSNRNNMNSHRAYITKEDAIEYKKECDRTYYLLNREHKIEYDKTYYLLNKEHITERTKKWNEDNKEHLAEIKKKWNEDNKEEIAINNKQWRQANKEHIAERTKKWRQANKEHIAERTKKWKQANKDRINEQQRKRRQDNKNK